MKTIFKKGKAEPEEDIPDEILNPSTFVNTVKKTSLLKKINEDIEKIKTKAKEADKTPEKDYNQQAPELNKIHIDKDLQDTKPDEENYIFKNQPLNKKLEKTIQLKKIGKEPVPRVPELTLEKHTDNPIISPRPENGWEAWQTFNPAAILINDKVYFLYRAIGDDGISRFGYAMSKDGFKINERLPYPVYEHEINIGFYICKYPSGGSIGGCEDPKMTRVGDEDRIYVTYTGCDGGLRIALTSIKVDDFLNKKWNWKKPVIISPPGENHKNWVIFPEKINGKYAILHSINSGKILIDYFDNLDFKDGEYINSKYQLTEVRMDRWDTKVRGAGPPPIKTKYGWLLLYHAEDKDDPGKYKVGVMILDIEDPTKILYRCKQPVLEPKEYYEYEGAKGGVVYAQGAVVKDGKLIIYYGGADNYVCAAYTELEPFLEALVKGEKKALKLKPVKKK